MTDVDKKKIEKYRNLILDIPGINSAEYINSTTSSVTLSWGVEWSPDYIARDIIQNFRDANHTEIDAINVKTKNDQIVVSAKSTFDLRKLLFLGSNKAGDDETIGQFGEGAKAAYVSMIKMGVHDPINVSGDQAVVISVGPEVIEDMRPLVYHWFRIPKQNQTLFVVNTYNKELKKAFDFGLNHFWYEQNSLKSDLLYEYNDISTFKSTTKNEGYLFYGGIMRARIPHVPVCINISKKYIKIENKIKADRDRNSFSSALTNTFLSIWARSGFYYNGMKNNKAIKFILEKSRSQWPKGLPILSALANYAYHLRDDKSLHKLFGNKYYAESLFTHSRGISWGDFYDTKTQSKILRSDKNFEKKGRIKLPSYFVRFGVPSSLELFVKNKKAMEKRRKSDQTASLSKKQRKAVDYALSCVEKVAPAFSGLYSQFKEDEGIFELNIKAVKSEDILGELKDGRGYGDKTIYLNQKLFKEKFPRFFSILSHEMAHVFGGDGERQFSDVLTHILEQAVQKNSVFSRYSKTWEKAYRI